ncbi:hypothetical protein BDV98DRAFT_577852, partial [Pterulicium gracile]
MFSVLMSLLMSFGALRFAGMSLGGDAQRWLLGDAEVALSGSLRVVRADREHSGVGMCADDGDKNVELAWGDDEGWMKSGVASESGWTCASFSPSNREGSGAGTRYSLSRDSGSWKITFLDTWTCLLPGL